MMPRMQTVWITRNPFDVNAYSKFEAEDVREVLLRELPVWPKTARLYHKEVALANDVTPSTPRKVDELASMPGPFYAVVYPADQAKAAGAGLLQGVLQQPAVTAREPGAAESAHP
jgi:hypothetical protein